MSRSVVTSVVVGDSSVIRGLGYNAKSRSLTVEFVSGGFYRYSDVPAKTFQAVAKAPSVGKAFCATIKGKFSSDKIEL
jgi:hypothetical protein